MRLKTTTPRTTHAAALSTAAKRRPVPRSVKNVPCVMASLSSRLTRDRGSSATTGPGSSAGAPISASQIHWKNRSSASMRLYTSARPATAKPMP